MAQLRLGAVGVVARYHRNIQSRATCIKNLFNRLQAGFGVAEGLPFTLVDWGNKSIFMHA